MNLMLKRRVEQIRQRWWVVAVVAVLTVLAVLASSLPAHPTYVGKSTSVFAVSAPQQDAMMVVGYMTIFNDPATIARLRTTAKIPEDVTFEARAVAASPILTIEATAHDPKVAQDAAADMAQAFRADLNAVSHAGTDSYIANLERELAEIPPVDAAGTSNPYYAVLRDRIDSARALQSNALQPLQPRAGVTENAPNIASQTRARGRGWIAARHPRRAGSGRSINTADECGRPSGQDRRRTVGRGARRRIGRAG